MSKVRVTNMANMKLECLLYKPYKNYITVERSSDYNSFRSVSSSRPVYAVEKKKRIK